MDRAFRRRRLRADREAIVHGIDVTDSDPSQIVSLMRALHDEVRQSVQVGRIAPFMNFVYDSFNKTEQRFSDAPVACAKGCAHCCRIWVSANVPEILHLVNAFPRRDLPRIHDTIRQAYAGTKGKSFEERGRMVTPCPMLDGDICSIHAVRPTVCRSGASANAEICARAFRQLTYETIPIPAVYPSMRLAYTLAFAGALKRAGLVYYAYEFNEGLMHALATPGAEADWLAGKDVFAGVQRDTGDVFDNPAYRQLYDAAFA